MSLTGGPRLSTVPFKDLNSFSFDGVDDYIDCGDNTNLSFGDSVTDSPFSISVWVKMDDATKFRIVTKAGGGSNDNEYALFTASTDQLFLQLYDSTTGDKRNRYYTTPLTSYEGQWIHIVSTYDGRGGGNAQNGIKLYLNGNRIDDASGSGGSYTAMHNTTATLEIAKLTTTYSDGNIDELSVFNTELSASDVTTIYNDGIPNNLNDLSTPPLYWWRMGDNAIWNGQTWIMPNSGTDTGIVRSINMVEDNRTTDVPPNPWVNTLSTSFDGVDDYVRIGTTSLGITTAISVSAWVKIPTTNTGGGGTNIQVIACEDTTSGGQRNWMMFWRGTGYNYFAFVVHHTNLSTSSVVSTSIIPNDGQWHNLLGTFDGTTNTNSLKLYIDGVLNVQGTAGSTGINSFTSSEPTIGATTGGVNWKFEGNIDEVAVWNTDQSANVSAIGSTIPTDLSSYNPLSWWRMGDGSTYPTINDEIGSNDGTMTNMSSANFVTDVPTFSKKSITLDGIDDLVTMGDVLNMANDGTDAFTYSLWFKTTHTGSYQALVSKGRSSVWFNGVTFSMRGDLRNFYISLGTVQSNQRISGKTGLISDINDGNWHHVCLTYDGSQVLSGMTLYYDNSLVTLSVDGTNGIPTNVSTSGQADFMIGARGLASSPNVPFNGNLDEVSYFTSELSVSDVSTIYNSGFPNDISSLSPIGWWRCGDGDTSPTLTDNGTGGNDGTMTNFSTFSTDVPN